MKCLRWTDVSVLVALAFFFGCFSVRAETKAEGKPNILWLIAEDMGPEWACYGTKEVKTPNLDQMAAGGMRFTRCYAGPVCSPSRSAFMTGMYATTIGAHNHRTGKKKPLPEGVRLITAWMADLGYFTANIKNAPPDAGFKGSGKTDWNFQVTDKPFNSEEWGDLKNHQPFFAQINFGQSHRPFKAPAQADPAKVEIPPYYPDHPVTRKDWAQYLDEISEFDRRVGLVLARLKKDGLEDNTIVIVFGDNGQAHVRGKQFCYESGLHVPLVICWPAGIPLPPKYVAGTVDSRLINLIDLAPTMISLAGGKKPAKMEGHIFLGAECEPDQPYVYGSRDRCDSTVMRLRTVRDQRYRYIRNFMPEVPFLAANAYKEKSYPVWNLLKELHAQGKLTPEQAFLCQPRQPEEELYDLESDPFEIKNLAKSEDPEHQAVLKRLRSVLEKWITDTNDQGAITSRE